MTTPESKPLYFRARPGGRLLHRPGRDPDHGRCGVALSHASAPRGGIPVFDKDLDALTEAGAEMRVACKSKMPTEEG